jgi:glc operon protein GlcG
MIQRILTITLLVAASFSVISAADLTTKKALNLEVAKAIAAASEAYARANNWNVIITILDDGGNMLYMQRMDGAQIGSIAVSLRKAQSAINFKRPTKVFADRIADAPGLAMLPGAIANEGGLTITVDGEVIGSIGVSGVTAQQDGMIGQAGIDALPKILSE